jgi:hypothetical protein
VSAAAVAQLEEQLAELDERDEKFGLGSTGKARRGALQKALTAAHFTEKKNLAELEDALATADAEYLTALETAIAAATSYVEAREELSVRAEAYHATRRKAYAAGLTVSTETSLGLRSLPIFFDEKDGYTPNACKALVERLQAISFIPW